MHSPSGESLDEGGLETTCEKQNVSHIGSIIVQRSQRGEYNVRKQVEVNILKVKRQSQLAGVGKVFWVVFRGCVGCYSIYDGHKFPDLESLKLSDEDAPICTRYGETPDRNMS